MLKRPKLLIWFNRLWRTALAPVLLGGILVPGVALAGLHLENPPGGIFTQTEFKPIIVNVINFSLVVAGLVAVLFIIIGGYQYVMSRGNEEAQRKGRTTLTYAIIGMVVVLLALVIVQTVDYVLQ